MSNLSNKIAEDATVCHILNRQAYARTEFTNAEIEYDAKTVRSIIQLYEKKKAEVPHKPLNLSPADILIRDEMINKTKLQQDYVAMQRHAFPDAAIKEFGTAEIIAQHEKIYRMEEIRERTKRFFLYLFAMIFVTICLINW